MSFFTSWRRDPYLRWAALLVLVAFAIRVCSIWANLPDVPNPDEFMFVWPPLRMAYGTWDAVGGYPPLYAYILLVEYGIFYIFGVLLGRFTGPMDFAVQMMTNPVPLYLIGRVTSVLLGSATILVLYAIGRRLYDGRVGLLAAAFLTFDTVHVYASQVVKNDVLMVFLLTLAFWFTCSILREGRRRDYVLTGLLAGLAMAAKYNAAVVTLPILVVHLLYSRRQGKGPLRAFLAWPLWIAGICVVAGFLLGYPHFVLDPGLAWEGLRGHSTDFFWAWLGWEEVPLGWIYYPVVALNTAWGLPLQLLAIAGLFAAFVRRCPADLLLCVLPLANYLLMGSVRVNQPRYFLLGMPCLLVLAARLLAGGWEWVRKRLPASLGRAGLPIAAALLVVWPAGMSIFQDYMLLQPDPRVMAAKWIEENLLAGSRVVVDQGGPTIPASPESLLEQYGPPQGRFAEVERELAADRNLNYWVLQIRHYIVGQSYLEGREATVQTMDWYRDHGYRYVITSDLVYNSYMHYPGVAARYPKTMAFYADVAQQGKLLAEFAPVAQDPRDFTFTDLNPIPTIRVYDLGTDQ